MAFPSVMEIVEALEEAYAERGTDKAAQRSAAARAHVLAEYDADTVYAKRWRPFLAALEADLERQAQVAKPKPRPVSKKRKGRK
jgi:hypothetical protein